MTEINHDVTSLKSQMRRANRINARKVIIIGEDEVTSNSVSSKDMATKEEISVGFGVEEILGVLRKD